MSHITQSLALLTDDEAKELREFGRQLAKGHDSPHSEDIEAMERHADSFAALVKSDPYDPDKYPHDRVREAEHQHSVKELHDHLIPAKEFAAAHVRALREELARRDQGLSQPLLSSWIVAMGISVLALTIAPTLHDQLFIGLNDEVLAWLASALCSAFVGAFIVWSLLGSASVSERRTTVNVIGLVAGIGIGVGMGLLRMAHATSSGEYVFAGALTIIEISAVVGVEFVASGLRRHHHAWMAQEEVLAPIRADLASAEPDEKRCADAVAAMEDRIHAHRVHVERRHARHSHVDEIRKAARGELEQGYHERLAENWHVRQGSSRTRGTISHSIRRVA